MNKAPGQLTAKPPAGSRTAARLLATLLSCLLLAAAGISAGAVSPHPAAAQEEAAEVGSVYNDQMTPEEVEAECRAGGERITAEFNRLTEDIRVHEADRPEYYAAEKAKLDAWLTERTESHDAECEKQKAAALARQLIPGAIASGYHDEMTPEEVEAECENVDRRIAAEYDRLLALIAEFEKSRPEYYSQEKAGLDAWRQLIREEKQAECEKEKAAAAERQLPPTPIDDLYPQISQEIKDLAAELGLTAEAKTILYNNRPELFDDPDDPGFTCGNHSLEEKVYVYGCWNHRGSIKVLRDNSIAITLAHELLHAAYYDFYVNYQNDDLDRLVEEAAAGDPAQTQIILRAYASQLDRLSPAAARYVRYTELHSFVGTQYANIPEELEEHYARYFKDRRLVLNIFRDWLLDTRAKLAERRKYNQQLLYQVGEYRKCLEDPHATAAACRSYLPDEDRYLNYDSCLASNKTFLRDCRRLRPDDTVDYAPIPPPATPPVSEPDGQSEREAEELIDRANQRQQATEESFINQLAEHDHEVEEAGEEEAEEEAEPENQAEEAEPADGDGRPEASRRRTETAGEDAAAGGGPKAADNRDGTVSYPLLFLAAAPLAGGGGFTITFLIVKRRRKSAEAGQPREGAGRTAPPPETAGPTDEKEDGHEG